MPWRIRWSAMAISRFKLGKGKNAPYERQTGRSCDIEVLPFGGTILYRVPEVARDRHQVLEEVDQRSGVGTREEYQRHARGHRQGHHKHGARRVVEGDGTDTGSRARKGPRIIGDLTPARRGSSSSSITGGGQRASGRRERRPGRGQERRGQCTSADPTSRDTGLRTGAQDAVTLPSANRGPAADAHLIQAFAGAGWSKPSRRLTQPDGKSI
ncbi:hypothetical protein N9L19_00775, partial [bacterium]|nr:hypothetical protein [bacterium]